MIRPLPPPRAATYLSLFAILLTLFVATPAPAHAADDVLQVIRASGSQDGGRWQVFELDERVRTAAGITIVGTWRGDGDVNMFLRDSEGNGLAHSNGKERPEVIEYSGDVAAASLAVLVRSGSAKYRIAVTENPLQTIESAGSPDSGRWQVFELDEAVKRADALSIIGTWEGDSDVNLFLRDGTGKSIAHANGTENPERITYAGDATPASLAVLVKSGFADYTIDVHRASPSAPDPAPEPESDYPGQPASGQVYWGASIQGNSDPVVRHEQYVDGTPMGVRRTFFQWHQRATSLVYHAGNDVAEGRVPWVSVKTPGWDLMASGAVDDEIDEMLGALDALDGPVWLTIHHEPDGGGGNNFPDDAGGPAAHLAMNAQVRERMDTLGVDNVALAPILMAWAWDPRSGRDAAAYWDSDVYDFVGVDIYAFKNASMMTPIWYTVREFAAEHGVDVAVGEWSIPSNDATAAAHMRDFYDEAVGSAEDGRGAQVAALAFFDSDNPTHGGYTKLRGDMLTTFRQLMKGEASIHRDR